MYLYTEKTPIGNTMKGFHVLFLADKCQHLIKWHEHFL